VIIAEQARLRERTRIAQDMHDALGHQLALISLQAASLEVDATLGAAQRETTRLLGATARAAMDELRVVVGALYPPDETAPELPLRGIDELVERARGAGLQVSVAHEGQEQPLSTITQHALYRVIQESLTNAHKHAPGSPVTVTLRYEPGTLVAEVRNPRLPARAASARGGTGGQGIIGLRERVRVIGGLLRGPRRRGLPGRGDPSLPGQGHRAGPGARTCRRPSARGSAGPADPKVAAAATTAGL
jgi:signal transduction histidine kinase